MTEGSLLSRLSRWQKTRNDFHVASLRISRYVTDEIGAIRGRIQAILILGHMAGDCWLIYIFIATVILLL